MGYNTDAVVVAVGKQTGNLVYGAGNGDRQRSPLVQMTVVGQIRLDIRGVGQDAVGAEDFS
jgi:hypothetical protein